MISVVLFSWWLSPAFAEDDSDVTGSTATPGELRSEVDELREAVRRLEERLEATEKRQEASSALGERLSFQGYGEIHANFAEGSGPDLIDIHRLVFGVGYEFAEWIQLGSEIEIEHGLISDDDQGDGEVVIEQLTLDFFLTDVFNVRAGRFLTPVGIINQTHEPPSFNGVERPSFAKTILPSTWSTDGIGIFGRLSDTVQYQAYIGSGLEGAGLSALDGIRGGRNSGRPSLHEPAFTARLDWFPLVHTDLVPDHDLRVGISYYRSGLDNGAKGVNPDVSGDVSIYSADVEYSVHRLDLRGVAALEKIRDADSLTTGVASQIVGGYLEAAYHVLPDSWKTGKMEESDLVVFARHDWIDTQNELPSGVQRDPAGQRTEWTTGLTYFFTPALVAKADVQFRQDKTSRDLPILFNLGLGWIF